MQYLYVFDLSRFESGKLKATKMPYDLDTQLDSEDKGFWTCVASHDGEALDMAYDAAWEDWSIPETRSWDQFKVEFVESPLLKVKK